jgi:5-methylcytosine-specific restriction enzyme A
MANLSQSRRQAWLRDELVLALDLYRREGANARDTAIAELSAVLRSIPIEHELTADPAFRSVGSVARRLANYLYLDPGSSGGLAHGGRGVAEVWAEYANDPGRLAGTATAIRANLTSLSGLMPIPGEELADAEEGRILTLVHTARERSRRLVALKKASALSTHGRLECEACGFDFEVYGGRGSGFIECHHRVPVAQLRPGQRTRLSDLALVCANCHRMIHVRRPWLTVEEVKDLRNPQ